MSSVGETQKLLEQLAPPALRESWDNAGLLVGDPREEVSCVGFALNPLPSTVRRACDAGCSLLVTHHPAFFSLQSVVTSTLEGEAIALALKNGLSILSLHTNLDRSFPGINTALARMLNLDVLSPLIPPDPGFSNAWGDGAVGRLPREQSFGELIRHVETSWRLSWSMAYRSPRHENTAAFSRVALLGGSGGGFYPHALEQGAEVFISGDIKYHHRIEALQRGLSLIMVDHGEMEEAAFFSIAGEWQQYFDSDLSCKWFPLDSWERPWGESASGERQER